MVSAFIGTSELLLIGALALLLVGGKKLPEMMRGLGKGIREFKDGMKDVASDTTDNGITDNDSLCEESSTDSSEPPK